MNESVTVVLLNAEGDQFNASFVAEGRGGGTRAAEAIHALARRDSDSIVVVYLVADRTRSISFPDKRVEAFLAGFGSTNDPSFVVEPIDGSPVFRITQLLDLYATLDSTRSILLGSLHTNQLYSELVRLPPACKDKVTLISTVTVAPCYRQLTSGGSFTASRAFEPLFGQLLTPDVAAKLLWDSVDSQAPAQADSCQTKENAITGDIWSHDDTSWRVEDNPPEASSSKSLGLIWDVESDDDLPAWHPTSQLELSPPLSPQRSPSPEISHSSASKFPLDTSLSPSSSSTRTLSAAASPLRPLSSHPAAPLSSSVVTTSPSTNPHPVRPIPKRSTATTTDSLVTRGKDKVVETVTQTPLGPVSSLAAFQVPVLTFSAFTQPCKRHYCLASGCPQTAQSCRFSHEFPFTQDERDLFPVWVKGTVCMDATRGKCKKSDQACHQGHRCPFTNQGCPFGKKCKFRQFGMPHSSRV